MLAHDHIRVFTQAELIEKSNSDSKKLAQVPGMNGGSQKQALQDLQRGNYLGTHIPTKGFSHKKIEATIRKQAKDKKLVKFFFNSCGQRMMASLFLDMSKLVRGKASSETKQIILCDKLNFLIYRRDEHNKYKAFYLTLVFSVNMDGRQYSYDPTKGLIDHEEPEEPSIKLKRFKEDLKAEFQFDDLQDFYQLMLDELPNGKEQTHVDIMACMEEVVYRTGGIKPVLMGIDEITISGKQNSLVEHNNILLYSNTEYLSFAAPKATLLRRDINKRERIIAHKQQISHEISEKPKKSGSIFALLKNLLAKIFLTKPADDNRTKANVHDESSGNKLLNSVTAKLAMHKLNKNRTSEPISIQEDVSAEVSKKCRTA